MYKYSLAHEHSKKTVHMPYICSNPEKYADGKSHGESSECVALVKVACAAPQTALWKKGSLVKNNSVSYGSAIATFNGSKYEGHAAIYLSQNADGIQVIDQWNGHGASKRTLRWGGSGRSNDGNQFYVVN